MCNEGAVWSEMFIDNEAYGEYDNSLMIIRLLTIIDIPEFD